MPYDLELECSALRECCGRNDRRKLNVYYVNDHLCIVGKELFMTWNSGTTTTEFLQQLPKRKYNYEMINLKYVATIRQYKYNKRDFERTLAYIQYYDSIVIKRNMENFIGISNFIRK